MACEREHTDASRMHAPDAVRVVHMRARQLDHVGARLEVVLRDSAAASTEGRRTLQTSQTLRVIAAMSLSVKLRRGNAAMASSDIGGGPV